MIKDIEMVTIETLRHEELLKKERLLSMFMEDGDKFHPLKENKFYQMITTVKYYWYKPSNGIEDNEKYDAIIRFRGERHYGYFRPLLDEAFIDSHSLVYIGKYTYSVLMR